MTVDTTSIPTPAVPPIVRTVAYFVLLAISAAVLIVTGLATIWLAPDMATKIVASGGVVTSALGVIAGGLGVAYRPTAAATPATTNFTIASMDPATITATIEKALQPASTAAATDDQTEPQADESTEGEDAAEAS